MIVPFYSRITLKSIQCDWNEFCVASVITASKEDLYQSYIAITYRFYFELTIVYTGTFGKINGVAYMVELAKELKNLNSSIKILLVGDGAEKDAVISNAKSIEVFEDNLFYENQIPKKDIPALLSAATMASALFIDLPEMRANSANKFFDALASGTPVFLNYGGWMHDLVSKHTCGINAWQINIKEAAKQLDEKLQDSDWLNKASISARQLAEQEFDRDKLAQQLITVLELVSEGKYQKVASVAPGKY